MMNFGMPYYMPPTILANPYMRNSQVQINSDIQKRIPIPAVAPKSMKPLFSSQKGNFPNSTERINCYLKDDGTLSISYSYFAGATRNSGDKRYDYDIKPDGRIYSCFVSPKDEQCLYNPTSIIKTDDITKTLINELCENLKQSGNRETTEKTIKDIVKSLESAPRYGMPIILHHSPTTGGVSNISFEITHAEKNKDDIVTNYSHKFSSYDFSDSTCRTSYTYKMEKNNYNTGVSETNSLSINEIPQNVKSSLLKLRAAFEKEEVSYEDVDSFVKSTLLPLQNLSK